MVGADGEKSISNVVCSSFPASILLLCHKHMEENMEKHLLGLTEAKNKMIITQIFRNSYTSGLVDSTKMEEFDESPKHRMGDWGSRNGEI